MGLDRLPIIAIFLIFLSTLFQPTSAGDAPAHLQDLQFIRSAGSEIVPTSPHAPARILDPAIGRTNKLNLAQVVASGLIRFYQKFISSQDLPVCNFTPSCSRFGQLAIQRYGLWKGLMLTGDRLYRCNGLAFQHYPLDHETGRCYDPIEVYAPKELKISK